MTVKQYTRTKRITNLTKSWLGRFKGKHSLICADPRCPIFVKGKPCIRPRFGEKDLVFTKYTSGGTSKKKRHRLLVYHVECAEDLGII